MLRQTDFPIEDDRIRLRPIGYGDADAYAEGTADADVRAFAHLPEPHYTAEMVRELVGTTFRHGLQTGELAVLAIADRGDDRFLGSLVVFDIREGSAEVGFWLHPVARGKGVSARALALIATLAADSGLTELRARTVAANVASQRVLDKAGYTFTGRDDSRTPSGATVDCHLYSARL